MTAERRAAFNAGSAWFRSLDKAARWELGDELVLGSFRWENWLDTQPEPGFMAGVERERIRCEQDG